MDILQKWMPLSEVKELFGYRTTQLSQMLKDSTLKVAKVGKRKFVLRESVDKFLQKKAKISE